MRVHLLSSGSSGNAALLESGGARILIDAGLSLTATVERLKALGVDLFPRGVDAIFITHHHGDHVGHAIALARATKATAYLHDGVEAVLLRRRAPVARYGPEGPTTVGEVTVRALSLPHDAPQMALRFEGPGGAFAIATDLGAAAPGLDAFLAEADVALLEANYCEQMLEEGPYPARLKDRIRGGRGHLSNAQTAALARGLSGGRLRHLHLGHLSRTNNDPSRVAAAMASAGGPVPFTIVPHGEPRPIVVAP